MKVILLLVSILTGTHLTAQNLTGQWRGNFNTATNSIVAGEGDIEYVLEIEIEGSKISGYSYSYFNYYSQNYYVICRLEGNYEKDSKSIVVNEEERIKGNTPPGWSDCLQTHILTFLKQGNTEKLVGRWRGYKPDGCGVGSTELERKMLTKVEPPKAKTPVVKKPVTTNKPPQNVTTAPKTTPKTTQTIKPTTKPDTKPAEKKEESRIVADRPGKVNTETSRTNLPQLKTAQVPAYGSRNKQVLKTIDVPNFEEFRVDFYDNGEIDGDTITVYFNNKILLSKQRLTDKPLSITVKLDPSLPDNELVMYADNLGKIPPNTALMIATINGKRHEVHITSTDKSSGTIRFRKKDD